MHYINEYYNNGELLSDYYNDDFNIFMSNIKQH